MLDIREIIASLDDDDKKLWKQHRTEMRRSYLTAHQAVRGTHTWTESDDIFMDYIDIKLALLFDESGRTNNDRPLVDKREAVRIEDKLSEELDGMKSESKPDPSKASLMIKGWGNGT